MSTMMDLVKSYGVFVAATFIGIGALSSTFINVSASDTTSGLVFSYTFDNSQNFTQDSVSGNSAPTRSVSSVQDSERGSVARFQRASNSYLTTPAQLSTGSYTKSAWVKWSGSIPSGAYENIMSRGTGGSTKLNFFGLHGNSLNNAGVRASNNHTVNNPILNNSQGPAANSWVHMVLTYDGSSLNYYKDGVIVATVSGVPVTDAGQTVQIGAYQNANSFDGLIDDARLYNRALTSEDVYSLYEAQSTGIVTPPLEEIDGPTNISEVDGDRFVQLAWDAPVANVTDYIIEYKLISSASWSTYNDGVNSQTNAKVQGLLNDNDYQFRITARNDTAISAPSTAISGRPQFTGYDVFIISGQSNTMYGLGYDSNLDAQDSRVYQWGRSGADANQSVPAVEPLQNISPVSGRIGFGLAFAKTYADNELSPTRRVLLLPEGWAGQSISQWAVPNGTMTTNIISRSNAAMASNVGNSLKGFLWVQGETDTGLCCSGTALSQSDYQFKLKTLLDYLEHNVTGFSSQTPIVLGQMVPSWASGVTAKENINNATLDMVNQRDKLAIASATFPYELGNNDGDNDSLHYSASSQRLYGPRFYTALLEAKTQSLQLPQYAPFDLTLSSSNGTNLIANWQIQPSTTSVDSYEVSYKLSSDTTWTTEQTVNNSQNITLTNMQQGQSYDVRVRALNEVGFSDYSQISNITLGQSVPQDITSGLQAVYGFNNLLTSDDSGNGFNLINKGATQITDPIRGSVAHFTRANNQWLNAPSSLTINPNGYTLSAWVKWTGSMTGATPYSNIISRASGGSNKLVIFALNRNFQPTRVYGSNNHPTNNPVIASSVGLPAVNQWVHLVLTYSNGTLFLYKDGQLVDSTANAPVPNSGQVPQVGGFTSTNGAGWDGDMDDIRIYNRGLLPAEVTYLYQTQLN